MMHARLYVCVCCQLIGASLQAQVRLGDTLRVYQGASAISEGVLARADFVSFDLRPASVDGSVRVLRANIQTLERKDGRSAIGRGAVITGVAAGAVAGWLGGAAVRSHDEQNGGLLLANFPYRAVGAGVGALGGLLVGALVARIEITHWSTVPAYFSVSP